MQFYTSFGRIGIIFPRGFGDFQRPRLHKRILPLRFLNYLCRLCWGPLRRRDWTSCIHNKTGAMYSLMIRVYRTRSKTNKIIVLSTIMVNNDVIIVSEKILHSIRVRIDRTVCKVSPVCVQSILYYLLFPILLFQFPNILTHTIMLFTSFTHLVPSNFTLAHRMCEATWFYEVFCRASGFSTFHYKFGNSWSFNAPLNSLTLATGTLRNYRRWDDDTTVVYAAWRPTWFTTPTQPRIRVAASALVVTSCFANTLFITPAHSIDPGAYTSPVCVSVCSH